MQEPKVHDAKMATKPGHLHSVSLADCGYLLSEASVLGKGGGWRRRASMRGGGQNHGRLPALGRYE